MKKIVSAIVFVCYLAVTSGVVINYHYCMNRLESTQLFANDKKVCGKCGMHNNESSGCCHDEVKVVKLQLDQTTTPAFTFNLSPINEALIIPSEFIAAAFYNINEQKHFHNHSPPLLSAQDTYLQINVFRI